jgi:SPP1 gp7 family putative phage head morphogenesis protein
LVENGKLKTFAQFKNDLFSVGYLFNKTHLQVEYDAAVANAQMAAQWQSFETNDVKFLEYNTVGDDRVRPEHKKLDGFTAKRTDAIWNIITPINDWGCRCSIIPGVQQNSGKISLPMAPDWAKDYGIKPLFQRNAGKDKLIFSKQHPYLANKAVYKQAKKYVKNESSAI